LQPFLAGQPDEQASVGQDEAIHCSSAADHVWGFSTAGAERIERPGMLFWHLNPHNFFPPYANLMASQRKFAPRCKELQVLRFSFH
jgi:hypothetical protein